ncbi:hypothetical protein B0H14DRAFT_3175518 [Mycena olivaceomarginata]|nr:hypothetical protein B0H14DRAFT_3175518 [Mycena olivaceomarginata]
MNYTTRMTFLLGESTSWWLNSSLTKIRRRAASPAGWPAASGGVQAGTGAVYKEACGRGYRAKAEELIRDLLGPVYLYVSSSSVLPGRSGEQAWSPTVAGLVKRELLKDVLSAFARSKTLTKLAQDWQDVLKRASEDGDR